VLSQEVVDTECTVRSCVIVHHHPPSIAANVKTMLIAFFDCDGIIHNEFVPAGQIMNSTLYKDVLQRLL
jgi:hypothetical protein